jgi:hypothetical protein
MATFDAVFGFEHGPAVNIAVGAGAASAAVAMPGRGVIAMIADGDFHLAVGASGVGAPDATFIRIPADTLMRIDASMNTHVRVFNPGAAGITVQFKGMVR